jgi:hypothetical protein
VRASIHLPLFALLTTCGALACVPEPSGDDERGGEATGVGSGESESDTSTDLATESTEGGAELDTSDTDTTEGADTDEPLPDPCPGPDVAPPALLPVEPTSACDPDALRHAPAPLLVDGLDAVPIDVLALDATLEFHPRAETACVEATLVFQVGEQGGMPMLDHRQAAAQLWLDGEPLELEAFESHNFGKGNLASLRVLERVLEPCSVHQLQVRHPLAKPTAFMAQAPDYDTSPASVEFGLFLSDVAEGRYLESWLPANMPWDRHALELGLRIVDAEAEHTLITNGSVETLGEHDWWISFDDTTTAMDPMLEIVPSSGLELDAGVHVAANGQAIPWTIHRHPLGNGTLMAARDVLFDSLDELVLHNGDYPHDEVVVYVWPVDTYSMEYRGATTTRVGSLRHELFHSWWARGIEPATYADGWFDEAWTVYSLDALVQAETPLDPAEGPWLLFDPHPFARVTPETAYTLGSRVFSGIAALVGRDALVDAMRQLSGSGELPRSLSTLELEEHLYCTLGELQEVRAIFHRYVHGLEGESEPAPPQWCA